MDPRPPAAVQGAMQGAAALLLVAVGIAVAEEPVAQQADTALAIVRRVDAVERVELSPNPSRATPAAGQQR